MMLCSIFCRPALFIIGFSPLTLVHLHADTDVAVVVENIANAYTNKRKCDTLMSTVNKMVVAGFECP